MIGPFWVGDRPTRPIEVDISRPGIPSDLTEFTTADVSVTDPNGESADQLFSPVLDSAAQLVLLNWASDSLDTVGAYVVQIRLTGPNSTSEWTTPITFIVNDTVASGSDTWATLSDVKNITGQDVDVSSLLQGQNVVEVYARVSASDTWVYGKPNPESRPFKLSRGDARLLKQAVAYQAAWMENEPDMFSRSDVTSMSQDGVSANFSDTGLSLAPLTRVALDRLSWVGTRTTSSTRAAELAQASYVEWLDDQGDWKPLGYGGWKATN